MRRSSGICLLILSAALLSTAGCGGKKLEALPQGPGSQGDQRLMNMGRAALEDKKWQEARGYFQQLLDAYPRSQLAGDARLGIADSHFFQGSSGNLILATAEYQDFLTFFPNHPRADYAQYQIALSYYEQMKSPDRDQEPTETAVAEFEKLIELYRNSSYAEEGRILLTECYETLAESELRKGLFYQNIRKHCRGAISRYTGIIENYPNFTKLDQVYFELGKSYQMCRADEEALPNFQKVIDSYPDSEYREEAQTLLATLQTDLANNK